MRITVIGAGAMGGSFGGLLAVAGHEVRLIDIWDAHVDAIRRDGLRVDGALGEHRVRLPTAPAPGPDDEAELAIVFVDSNNTEAGAEAAAQVLEPDGSAITFQNGLGNVETLQRVLGRERVLAGSSMCSAAVLGPGHVSLTHMGPTTLGETDGTGSDRAASVLAALGDAGFDVHPSGEIMAVIWQKFVVNCSANAIAATTGLRTGEFVRVPEIDAFQDRVLDEVMAVVRARGITLPDPDIVAKIKAMCRKKFNRPSMLQHVTAGRRTEIDALNGALAREAEGLGIPVPNNQALIALLKGRELSQIRAIHEPDLDYDAWEARIAAGEE
ncbi:MAG: 2-dehydropantoate 2-reductase [Alphaproteobacteria bacterium]|jgi:2-dehydropantoate 2-reductase|nr:2-dehydropantoate 2-reductase [Alphaproteobacteria bacterium]